MLVLFNSTYFNDSKADGLVTLADERVSMVHLIFCQLMQGLQLPA